MSSIFDNVWGLYSHLFLGIAMGILFLWQQSYIFVTLLFEDMLIWHLTHFSNSLEAIGTKDVICYHRNLVAIATDLDTENIVV